MLSQLHCTAPRVGGPFASYTEVRSDPFAELAPRCARAPKAPPYPTNGLRTRAGSLRTVRAAHERRRGPRRWHASSLAPFPCWRNGRRDGAMAARITRIWKASSERPRSYLRGVSGPLSGSTRSIVTAARSAMASRTESRSSSVRARLGSRVRVLHFAHRHAGAQPSGILYSARSRSLPPQLPQRMKLITARKTGARRGSATRASGDLGLSSSTYSSCVGAAGVDGSFPSRRQRGLRGSLAVLRFETRA